MVARPCRRPRPSSLDDGGISGLFSAPSLFEEKKLKYKIILGYLPILVQLFALSGALSSVKVINSDRFMLYPLICFAITFYAASKLIEDERTYKHAIITVAVSAFLAILCTFGLS